VESAYYVLNTYVPELDGPPAAVYEHYFEQIAAAEEVGFDAVWVTEHHLSRYGGLTPNPQLLLTALSQRTRRLRLGSAVSVLPLHHPLRVAEDFAMLDVLSGGRLEFGAGRGMAASGYRGYGLSWDDAQDRMKEALTLIDRLWTEPEVAFEGRHYRCEKVTLMPRPLQQPRPPIWMPANVDPESFRWAGAHGYNLMLVPWVFPVERTQAGLRLYHEARAAAGHPGPGRILGMFPCQVAETAACACARAAEAWQRWRVLTAHERPHDERDPRREAFKGELSYEDTVAQHRALFGDPDACIAAVRWAAERFGLTQLGLVFHFGGIDPQVALRAVELWGREVAPALRREPELTPRA
jgi:alkanesulfonate monooxygenase SsuD/methylene tetrahydromethanopterin reductase-like flavin-dependent oxidoreductase (luciferase family)